MAAICLITVAAFFWINQAFVATNSDPNMPWNEEHYILSEKQRSQLKNHPSANRIDRVLRYKANVDEQGSPRGTVNLLIYPDGNIKGVWNGGFDGNEGVHQLIMAASYEGNIVDSKTNPDNPEAVYFITKGTYVMLETNIDTGGAMDRAGFLYVRGWLYPDDVSAGELVVTADRRTCEIYTWGAMPLN